MKTSGIATTPHLELGDERFLRRLLDSVREAIIATRPDGTVIYWSAGAEQLYGWSSEEALGRNIVDLNVQEASREQAEEIMASLATGRPWSGEFAVRHRDGRTFVAEVTDSPVYDEHGGLVAVVGISSDVSRRRRAESELERFFTVSLEGLCIAGLDGYFKRINPALAASLGYTEDELLAEPFMSFVHEDDQSATLHAVERLTDGRDIVGFENRYRTRSGTYRWLHWNARAITEDGLIYAASRDVTEQKRREQDLVESNERLELAQLAGDVGIFDWDMLTGVVVWTDHLLALYGIDREEFGGDYAAWRDRVHPDDVARVEADVEEAVAGRSTWMSEFRIVRPDGEVRWIAAQGRTLYRGAEPFRFLGVNIDVTDRKRMETALLASEARFRSLFENSADAILLTMPGDGSILAANGTACEMFGLSEDELRTVGRAGVVDPGDERLRPALREREETGRMHAELRCRRGDGTTFEGDVTSSLFQDADGSTKSAMIIRDVTRRKEAEAALVAAQRDAEEASRAKSEFLSGMSHELRTPLNAVLGFGQLLQLEELAPAAAESVGRILAAGEHLLELIDELLDLERIESGRLAMSPEPVPVRALVDETLGLVEAMAESRASELHNAVPAEAGWHVQADHARLRQVLLNLLVNALRHGPEGNVVEVEAGPADAGMLRLGVRDRGDGIPQADHERIFEPFERLATDSEGTGLGLTLSRRLVEAMGGTIGVESRPGAGSLFWVELSLVESPLENHLASPGETSPATVTAPASAGQLTVLYVEDNLSNLTLIEAILRHRPSVRLLSAMQGRLGVQLAVDHRPDLVLLDLHLPDLDGEDVLRSLKADERTRSIPVVVISADATQRQIDRLIAAGAEDYLTKPFHVGKLLEVVDGVREA